MEFPFPISKPLDLKQDGFTMIASSDLMRDSSVSSVASFDEQDASTKYLPKIIDMLGEMISQIQDSPTITMTYNKFIKKDYNKMYIKADLHKIYGFLLVKIKDSINKKEKPEILIKDFFVYETVQRTGVGHSIFEYMLDMEEIQPAQLLFKNPTEPMLSFLEKHYGLASPIPAYKDYVKFDASKIVEPKNNFDTKNEPKRMMIPARTSGLSPELEDLEDFVNASPLFKNRVVEKKKTGRRDGLRNNKLNDLEISNIDKLLKAPSLLESNILAQRVPPEIKFYDTIENHAVKRFYEEIYKWHLNLEQEIAQEEKYFKDKVFPKSYGDKDTSP